MPYSAPSAPSGFFHASADVIIATVAGGLLLVVFYPLTLCAEALKGVRAILRLRPAPPRNLVNGKSPIPTSRHATRVIEL